MKKQLVLLVLLLCCVPVRGLPVNPVFALVVLPDTQKYSRYSPERFNAQTQWIVDHTASDAIAFTLHLGDVVERPREVTEWQAASRALNRLTSHTLPYSILAGNHDLLEPAKTDAERVQDDEPFLRYFGAASTQHPAYGGHSPSGFNSYFIFEAAGHQFMTLALDWRLSEESFAWAENVLKQHPDLPTILTTHDLMRRDGTLSQNGTMLWERLISPHNQIFLAIGGHYSGVNHTIMANVQGNPVALMLVDFQGDYAGGNGMLRLLTVDMAAHTLEATTFSPYVMALPEAERGENDHERKTDAANQFTLYFDILERFRR